MGNCFIQQIHSKNEITYIMYNLWKANYLASLKHLEQDLQTSLFTFLTGIFSMGDLGHLGCLGH